MSESNGQIAEPPRGSPAATDDDDPGVRVHETETLLRVARTIGATLDLPEVARRICREAARALGADSAGIYLRGDDEILRPVAGYRIPKAFLDGLADAPLSVEEFAELSAVLAAADGVWSDDVAADPRFDHPVFRRFPARSIVCARLETRDEPVGVLLCAWWTARHQPSAGERRVIEGIAAQAAIAILNARLFAKAEEVAISRERLRMAHELHASLSQSLFSMGLSLDWCLHRAEGDPEMREKLAFVHREAGTVLAHMRGLIMELAPGHDPRASFADRLRRLVADARELSGADVELIEHGTLERVSAAQQELLLRTFQEALANVVKHARARRVRVWLVVLPDRVEFEVSDDGVGLPEHVTIPRLAEQPGHLGLRQIMERVRGAGGEVELARGAPSGFTIRGTLPVGRGAV